MFYLGLLLIFYIELGSCFHILENNPLSVTLFANIFSYSIGCLFILFMVSFAVQKLISLIGSKLFVFASFSSWEAHRIILNKEF